MTRKIPPSFTLIELLIALSIFAVVAVTLYSAFFAGVSVWKRSGDTSGSYQDISAVFDDIARDLKNAVYFSKDEESGYAFMGAPGKIAFMTLEERVGARMKPCREIARLSYYFDDTADEFIKKRADISLGFDIVKAEKDVLLRGVEDFRFEYCYYSGDEDEPYIWQDEWSDEDARIPRGIRITAVMNGVKRGDGASRITRVIFIPTGVLGKKL